MVISGDSNISNANVPPANSNIENKTVEEQILDQDADVTIGDDAFHFIHVAQEPAVSINNAITCPRNLNVHLYIGDCTVRIDAGRSIIAMPTDIWI
jgi:hypothetical protein